MPIAGRDCWILPLAACWTVLACGAPRDGERIAQAVVRDSAGIAVVEHGPVGQFASGCVAPSDTPRLLLRSGSAGPDREFYHVRGGTVLATGDILVLNAGTYELLAFSPDGRLLRAVGGRGAGPGEFHDMDWIGPGAGDTIQVWDFRLGRLSTFDDTGALIASQRLRRGGPVQLQGRFDDNSFLAVPIDAHYFDGAPRVARFARPYERYDAAVDRWNHLTEGQGAETVSDGHRVYGLPFGKTERFVAAGRHLVLAETAVPSLRFYGLAGDLERIVRWVAEPAPVTDADRQRYVEWSRGGSAGRPALDAPLRFAAERPVLGEIHVDRLGMIWVQRYAPPWEPATEWLLFGAEGLYACRASLPPLASVLEIGEDYVLGTRRSELGEEAILVFDLWRQ